MSGWLLDTNVISELRRPRPSGRLRSFVAGQPLEDLFVSTVTFAELRYGIETVADPIRRAELNDWLLHRVRPMFDQRVLEVSEDVMFKWRLLVEDGRKVGHTFSQPDLIIAATALHHGLTVVTRDTGDYKLARVPLRNPWLDETS
ncbi:MAG: type II toxin-antitoxin system VapC family toxin [Burkholderiales bacterium]|nr:type II toxin-antitoxin system VapC family toxin [Burkholderiales bacterium]